MEAVNGVSEVDKGGPPAPSPLTGCYLLVVVGEPHSKEHKDIILRRIAKGLLSWDISDCHVDLEKELAIITEQAPEGEDARYGERLIQFASENLVTEILIHPAISTLSQCMKNLLSSFTRHRHIIHAGYTFAANGSWILQDGTFSLTDFSEAFQEMEVQRVLRAYDNSISLDIHCSPEGDWPRLPKESFTKNCKIRVNPDDVLTSGSPSIVNFLNYISPFLVPTDIETLLESSDVVGNIRFSHPTLYVFPGGQGDAALFGINGFNMLVDGGFARKACFWDFVRHLDRLDAVLLTRLNNSNVSGISSVLRRKRYNTVYPQIGHFFCNIQERKAILSPDGDKDKDPLIVNLLEEGQGIVSNLRQLHLQPQTCYRDIDPINLYHKVGHGTLDMYVLSPAKESKEVREFIQKWNTNDQRLFANQRNGKDFTFPTQNLVSICALLVWQPANANDSITRILFPGSTPQHKIFEGLDRLKQLECIKYPSCSAKTLTPSLMKSKQAKVEKIIQQEQKENKIKEKQPETKAKVENKVAEENIKNIQTNGVTTNQVISEKIIKKHDSTESEKSGPPSAEAKKTEEGKESTNLTNGKVAEEKVEKSKPKTKPEQKPKVEAKVYKHTRSIERKPKPPTEKKASPTTPKKTLDAKLNGDGPTKPKPSTKISPSATPAKSTKEANNRKVVESKYKVASKKDISKPEKKETKPERKPISRRPKESSPSGKVLESPVKKLNELHKVEARKTKLEKEGTTDSSTVSTPSADADTAMKKDISKLTPEELEQLKARELAELKEEQEVVKEIEAVFRKSEHKTPDDSELRKVKNISVDEKTEGEGEEYLIIEKEEIEHDSLDEKETKESETQKHLRDSEESEKQRKLSGEVTVEAKDIKEEKSQEAPTAGESVNVQENESAQTIDVVKAKEEKEQIKEVSKEVSVTSPDDKVDLSSGKKATDRDVDEENKDANVLESQPDEKFSTPIESGATTAPTLPEDERIPLDEIKEDNGDQIIEEKYVKEDTKEKEIPVVQLPPKTTEAVAKLPTVVGIRLDKQTPIRDLVKTPDEVADLPVHEEVDIENYEQYHVNQSQTPKQEELKQITAAKEAKIEKADKEPSTKREEKLAKEEKHVDDDQKAEETKQEPIKVVEQKDKLAEDKETTTNLTQLEVLAAGEKLQTTAAKDHEEEKEDLEKEKIEKVHEEEQAVEKVVLHEIEIVEKKEEKVTKEQAEPETVIQEEDLGKEKETVPAEQKPGKVEEQKAEVKEVTEKEAIQKQEEKVLEKQEKEKVEVEKAKAEVPKQADQVPEVEKVKLEKPVEIDSVDKIEEKTTDTIKATEIENEASRVNTEEEKAEKEYVEKAETEKDVTKAKVEQSVEPNIKTVEVEEEISKAVIEKEELESVVEEKDVAKIKEKIDDKKDEEAKAGKKEEEEVDVEQPPSKVDIEEELIEKIIKKEETGIKEPVEKITATEIQVNKEAQEIKASKTDAAKVDGEDIKKEKESTGKSDLGKLDDLKKLAKIASDTKHMQQIDSEKFEKEDVKEVASEIQHQDKGSIETTEGVEEETKNKMKEPSDEQNDDVEAKIVAIEKELVAVITEEIKEIKKSDEKTERLGKDHQMEEEEKKLVEMEKVSAYDAEEVKVSDKKEEKQEEPGSGDEPADIKEIKTAATVPAAIIEERSIPETEKQPMELHAAEDAKKSQFKEKIEEIPSEQLLEVHDDKVTTVVIKDLESAIEIKSDATKKEPKDAENVDHKIIKTEEPEPERKLAIDNVTGTYFGGVAPQVESAKHEIQKIEESSPKTETQEEAPVHIKEEVKLSGETEHLEDKIKDEKLEHVEITQREDNKKETIEEKSLPMEADKADLKVIDPEKVKEVAKSEVDEDSRPGKELTDHIAITNEKFESDVVKPTEKDMDDQNVQKAEDKSEDVKDKTVDKVETKKPLTDKATEEKQNTVDHKDTETKSMDEFTKENIYHEAVTLVEAERRSQDFVETHVAKIEGISEITVRDSEPQSKELDVQIIDPKEIKEVSEKSTIGESKKGTEDVKVIEHEQHDSEKKTAGVIGDDVKSDKEKSAIEQKEEDTGKSDKTLETAIAEGDKESVKKDKKMYEGEIATEKDETKKKEILPPTAKDVQHLKTAIELEKPVEKEKLIESKEESSAHDKLDDSVRDEKKDESKDEKLFANEEQLIKDASNRPLDKPVTTATDQAFKEFAGEVKEAAEYLKESDDIKDKEQEKHQVSEVEKVHEKAEDVITINVNEKQATIGEDFKTDVEIPSSAAKPKIEATELPSALDIKEPLTKMDSSIYKEEHETDLKISKSDITKLPEEAISMVEECMEKQIESEKISISFEKPDKAPLLETSKIEEKTAQQGEKDYVGEIDEKTAIKSFYDDSVEINKTDKRLQELKDAVDLDDKIESTDVDQEQSCKTQSQSKNEIDVVDKVELGRKSPKEREHDVAKIVASVAEVLKSDAPLEEFEGKIPLEITTFGQYELRETHITTVESPIREDIIDDKGQMLSIEEEKSSPRDPISMFLDEERKVAPMHTNYDIFQKGESRVSSLLKDSDELMQATSKIISNIKQSVKVDDDVVSEGIKDAVQAPAPAKDLDPELALEKLSSIRDELSPKPIALKEETLDPKKDSLDKKECDIKVESTPAKLPADSKEDIPDTLEVDKLQTSSGKSSPEIKEPLKETVDISQSLTSSGKASPNNKDILSTEKSPISSGKTTPDLKVDPMSRTTPDIQTHETSAGVLEPSIKPDIDINKPTSLSGKSSPEIKETIVDSATSEKVTPAIKDSVDVDKDVSRSGKTTPEIKTSTESVCKRIDDSDKISSDIKESVKKISLETTPVTSGRTTPDIKEPITNLEKSIVESEKTVDRKDNVKISLDTTPITSEKITPEIKEPTIDILISTTESAAVKDTVTPSADKTPITSSTTPEIKEPTTDISISKVESQTISADMKEAVKGSLDTTPISSDQATPKMKEPLTEVSKSVSDSEKARVDVKEAVKSHFDATSISSEITTPEVKEVVVELPITSVDDQNLISENKEITKSSLDTSPVISGKTTPEIKEPTETDDAVSSRKTSHDFVDKSITVSGKTMPEEVVKDTLPSGQSSIISGKSTPEIIETMKDTLSTIRSPMLSGRSTPDIVIHEDPSPVASGSSTPDIEEPADLGKCSAKETDSVTSSQPADAKKPITQIESDKTIVESDKTIVESDKKIDESEKHSSDVEHRHSDIAPVETVKVVIQCGADLGLEPSATSTDASKDVEATRKLSLDKSKSPIVSGKSTPDLQHSTKTSSDQVKSPSDSRKSSLMEPSDIEKTSSTSGKSTPDLKEPISVISGKTTPDTKLPEDKDSVQSASETKRTSVASDSKDVEGKDEHTIFEHTKIECVPGTSSSKEGRLSSSKSPTEELEYSRKSTPDIADLTKTKDLEESVVGSTTPPTVPVSPIIKEKHHLIHEQDKGDKKDAPEVGILKTSEARSSTPASDDCDISSGQVSRVLTTEEDDEKQVYSDDEDLPGSPLSATSQVAHSTSSQYDFEDSVRGVGPIDPMSTSFYGALPDDPVDLSKGAKASRFLDEADLDFDKALNEHRQTRGEHLTSGSSPSHVYEITTAKYASIKLQEETQIQKTASSAPVTLQKESLMTASFIGSELPTDPKDDPIASWGKPLGLPSPAPLNDNKGTPKKERRIPPNVMAKNKLNEDKKLSDSKYDKRGKKINPVYVDLTYVPHHGNSNYSYVDFFKRVRARYYVFSGIEPSREVYNALLEAKQTWDDKELEVTIIPTYDTDVLGYWVAENEDLLAKYKIDLSPSASRCTINLQDHETSCSAYRLEFS